MDICSAGSWPEIDHDSGDSADPNQESEPLSVEEGDRILATGLFPHPVRGHPFRPPSLTPTPTPTPDIFHPSNTPYVPPTPLTTP